MIMSRINAKKYLIAYFTHSGNSEIAAKMIQEQTAGSLFQIATMDTYPKDHKALVDLAEKELKENARPALKGQVDAMESYDIVFLVYPNWWWTIPMALFTFLEQYDFTGKIIMPLCTHEGSAMGRSESDIEKLCPKATVIKGLAVRGSQVKNAKDNITHWLEQIN
jgi:flavodoxin